MSAALSNVLDTLEGGSYHEDFLAIVEEVAQAVATRTPLSTDAPVLDFMWSRVKNWSGFGGLRNEADGAVSGFRAKNIVYQGMRNVLQHLGFGRAATSMFMSGPNPCKMASLYLQTSSVSRSEHVAIYV